uniref:Uncharacterized protein n=1 Tax=Romanomermis culicivorax TaxID=13658 RepID=A0A915KYL9_ROMCU
MADRQQRVGSRHRQLCDEVVAARGNFRAVSSFGCVVRVKTLTSRKPLGTIPKQKDRPWSEMCNRT